ncbi:TIR domain-containing protein [Actinoplanes sp. NPDC049681]|uniref:TIR domain-containing protein n=1 Tax=Actinoplanes sp. NPDC049681 TaxID=3363905 RepID=UPI0037AEE190
MLRHAVKNPPSPPRYDAFISYSRAADGQLAPNLQRELQVFAKPWNRRRMLAVFRDADSLSANPGLWTAIESALSQARYFVLLASPGSAASPWVRREVAWWLEHRTPQRILIVLTEGELVWRGSGFHPASSALPPELRLAFDEEPRWIDARWARHESQVTPRDPRFRELTADVAAPLHGRSKDDLIGEDVRQHRRTKRIARTAIASLATLLCASGTAAVIAYRQSVVATQQERLAVSRQIAATSVQQAPRRLDKALLLAVAAYRAQPTPQSRAALLEVSSASPALVRFLHHDADVTAGAVTPDGASVVTGTQAGVVTVWPTRPGPARVLLRGRAAVTAVAWSSDGKKIAVGDSSGAVALYETAGGRRRQTASVRGPVADVAISPDGRWAAAAGAEAVAVLDLKKGGVRSLTVQGSRPVVGFTADSERIRVGSAREQDSSVVTRSWRLPALAPAGQPVAMQVPASRYSAAHSPDRGYFGFFKMGDTTVYRAGSDKQLGFPGVDRTQADNFAVSTDGHRVAIAQSGVITIAQRGTDAPAPRRLTGGPTGSALLRFSPDGNVLLSGAGTDVAVFDLRQQSRLGQIVGPDVPDPNEAGIPPAMAVRPDGRQVAWVQGGAGDPTARLRIWDSGERRLIADTPIAGDVSALAYSRDGRTLAAAGSPGVALFDTSGTHLAAPRVLRLDPPVGNVAGVALSPDAASIVVAAPSYDYKQLEIRRLRTADGSAEGTERQEIGGELSFLLSPAGDALIEQRNDRSLVRVDTTTGARKTLTGPLPADGPIPVFSTEGDVLTYAAGLGTATVRSTGDDHEIRHLDGVGALVTADARSGLAASLDMNGTLGLLDLATGRRLGEAPLQNPGQAERGDTAYQTAMAFVPGKAVLYSVTIGGDAIRWDFGDETLLAQACAVAGRDLTEAEWRTDIGSEPPADLSCRSGA